MTKLTRLFKPGGWGGGGGGRRVMGGGGRGGGVMAKKEKRKKKATKKLQVVRLFLSGRLTESMARLIPLFVGKNHPTASVHKVDHSVDRHSSVSFNTVPTTKTIVFFSKSLEKLHPVEAMLFAKCYNNAKWSLYSASHPVEDDNSVHAY